VFLFHEKGDLFLCLVLVEQSNYLLIVHSFRYLNWSPTSVTYEIGIGSAIQKKFHQMCMTIDIHKVWEFSAHDLFQFLPFHNVQRLDLFHNPNVRFQLFNI